jgi:uncharacterized protein YpuA (DUF1002 family)
MALCKGTEALMADDDLDIPEEMRRIAEEESKRYNVTMLDEAIRQLALVQMRVPVRRPRPHSAS